MRVLEMLRAVALSTGNAGLRREIVELGCAPRQLHPGLIRFGEAVANGGIDYKKFAVLYVDDEVKSLKLTARGYGRVLRIVTAASAEDALSLLHTLHPEIGVVFSDQRMPGAKGLTFLARVRELYPKPVRILVSTFGPQRDWMAAQQAVQAGLLHSCVVKPWSPVQLEQILKEALELRLITDLVHELGSIFAAP